MNRFLRSSMIPSMILAIALAGGALTVWGISIGFLGGSYIEARANQEIVEQLHITSSGKAIIETWLRRSPQPHLYYDLERRTVVLGEVEPRLQGQSRSQYNSFLRNGALTPPGRYLHWLAQRRFSIIGLDGGGHLGINWFAMEEEESPEHAYLVGYDRQSRQCMGYIGVQGFRLDKPPLDEQFAIGERSLNTALEALHASWGRAVSSTTDRTPVLIISDDKLYFVDLQFAAPQAMLFTPETTGQTALVDRTVRKLPLDEPVVSMSFANQAVEGADDKGDLQRILVRTSKHVLVLDLEGKLLRSAEIPPALVDRYLSVYLPVGDDVIFQVGDFFPKSMKTEITWINTKTADSRSEIVALPKATLSVRKLSWLTSAIVPSPALLAVFNYWLFPALQHPLMRPVDHAAYRAEIWAATWPGLLAVCFLSALAAAYVFRRQKRYGPRGAIGWAIFVLIAGPAGMLGYLWHRRWPVIERCPACGASAPRDREACRACRAEFPAPKQLGFEVFA